MRGSTAASAFSIVVPMLNEAAVLPELLAHLRAVQQQQRCECILVDGGSSDDSVALASAAGFTVLTSPPGRARQMNVGAEQASGEVLLFLHADTRLPADALAAITHALAGGRQRWGRFDVRIDGRSPLLRLVGWAMNWRSRLSGIATGDQAIFVQAALFRQLGGFPCQPLMEDIEFSRRAKAVSAPPLSAPAGADLGAALGESRRLSHHPVDVAVALAVLARGSRRSAGCGLPVAGGGNDPAGADYCFCQSA